MNKKQLIIIRGLPGSGKSKLAKSLVENGIIHSTDNYFVKDNIYKFDISKLSEYHEENLYDAIESMIKRISPIIIDNTNIISEHALPYVEAAEEFGYEVIVTETQTSWRFDIEELSKRNVHNCPKESIEMMIKMYEPIEKFKKKLGI